MTKTIEVSKTEFEITIDRYKDGGEVIVVDVATWTPDVLAYLIGEGLNHKKDAYASVKGTDPNAQNESISKFKAFVSKLENGTIPTGGTGGSVSNFEQACRDVFVRRRLRDNGVKLAEAKKMAKTWRDYCNSAAEVERIKSLAQKITALIDE